MRASAQVNPLALWKSQLDERSDQLVGVLPAHIPIERFKRTALTAAMNNPDLLVKCDRTSLFNAVMRAATDGLLPDGREGAIVEFKGKAQWLPMVAGLRKKVRQSGEIATWEVEVVCENDLFDYERGDEPFIKHKPALRNRGEVIAAYSIATLKSGEKSREVMSIDEIEEVRAVSRMGNRGPWVDWFAEMAKKTVARRHSKVLPMTTDLDDMMRSDDALFGVKQEDEEKSAPQRPPRGLKGKLQALASVDSGAIAKPAQEAPEARQTAHQDEIPAHDDDGVIDHEDGEQRQVVEGIAELDDEHEHTVEKVDPIAAARDKGIEARKAGYQRKALPGEYRREDRTAEAEAWTQGWLEQHRKDQSAKGVAP
jgi:recombination protein RecT